MERFLDNVRRAVSGGDGRQDATRGDYAGGSDAFAGFGFSGGGHRSRARVFDRRRSGNDARRLFAGGVDKKIGRHRFHPLEATRERRARFEYRFDSRSKFCDNGKDNSGCLNNVSQDDS